MQTGTVVVTILMAFIGLGAGAASAQTPPDCSYCDRLRCEAFDNPIQRTQCFQSARYCRQRCLMDQGRQPKAPLSAAELKRVLVGRWRGAHALDPKDVTVITYRADGTVHQISRDHESHGRWTVTPLTDGSFMLATTSGGKTYEVPMQMIGRDAMSAVGNPTVYRRVPQGDATPLPRRRESEASRRQKCFDACHRECATGWHPHGEAACRTTTCQTRCIAPQ